MSASVSPLNWTGNKGCIYETIAAFMPEHSTYIEPCMGGAEVFFGTARQYAGSAMERRFDVPKGGAGA